MAIRIIQSSNPTEDPAVRAVRDRLRAGQLTSADTGQMDVRSAVRDVIAAVEQRGDQAVVEFTKKFHNVALTPATIRVEPEKIAVAHKATDGKSLELFRRAIANIRAYQESILTPDPDAIGEKGRFLGVRYTPIDSVCVYVPGGKAIYPSTVLMTVVPAQVAGVRRVVMVSPPTCDGDIHPMVLALAGELGVTEVYRVAGVAGLAGLAIGTKACPQVDKIVGPGSAFIAEATSPNCVLPVVKSSSEIAASIIALAAAERMMYLNAPSSESLPCFSAIRMNEAMAVISRYTYSENRSRTRHMPFMPMTATNRTLMKWNSSRGTVSVARATRIVTNDTRPIDSSRTRLKLSAARWNVK